MTILPRVCAEFENKKGEVVYSIKRNQLLTIVTGVPEEIQELAAVVGFLDAGVVSLENDVAVVYVSEYASEVVQAESYVRQCHVFAPFFSKFPLAVVCPLVSICISMEDTRTRGKGYKPSHRRVCV